MADDDPLASFFSDIAAVESTVAEGAAEPSSSAASSSSSSSSTSAAAEEDGTAAPPAKRAKTATVVAAAKPAKPAVVVAAAAQPALSLSVKGMAGSPKPNASDVVGQWEDAAPTAALAPDQGQWNDAPPKALPQFGGVSGAEPPAAYKQNHMGMTDEEAANVAAQQSGYDYHQQQHLTSLGAGPSHANGEGGGKKKRFIRKAAGKSWEDKSLSEWPENDYRLFVGDLGNEVTDDLLSRSFSQYKSFAMAKIIRDKHTMKSKGFGFVSFIDPFDCAKALREMNGKYVGNRPVKIKKSAWKDRDIGVVRKKDKAEKKRKAKLGLL